MILVPCVLAAAAGTHNLDPILEQRHVLIAAAVAMLLILWPLAPRLVAWVNIRQAGERFIMYATAAAVLYWMLVTALATLNCMSFWRTPQRYDARVDAKDQSGGRRGTTYTVYFATPRGPLQQTVHGGFYRSVAIGDMVDLRLCRGVLGLLYLAHPGMRAPLFFPAAGSSERTAEAGRHRPHC